MTSNNILDIINKRYSCRSYTGIPLSHDDMTQLRTSIASAPPPPFGTKMRFQLIAKQEGDAQALKGLGTYGLLKGVPTYLVGMVEPSPNAMEDFGYVMESLVLAATENGFGTCWLGGTFTKSSFTKRAGLMENELLAAIIAIGYPANKPLLRERLTRTAAGSDRRLPWEKLFFEGNLGIPLDEDQTPSYHDALIAVRTGPSASNKQPWRIIKEREQWHFFLQRSTNYRRMLKTAGLVDLQRNDIGIAMYHWEAVLRDHAITGRWHHAKRYPTPPGTSAEYIVSWRAD